MNVPDILTHASVSLGLTPQDVEIGVGPWRFDFGIFGIVIVAILAFVVVQAVRKG
ncbi:hypothetical protein GCM10027418_00330 [Mariniluteicoccus endophyticus]